jgi:DNA-directed RNA polymerase specialized sigma24 family protein
MPRPLCQRLSPEQRSALVAAYGTGARQKDLAAEYGISIRSAKRLLRAARDSASATA